MIGCHYSGSCLSEGSGIDVTNSELSVHFNSEKGEKRYNPYRGLCTNCRRGPYMSRSFFTWLLCLVIRGHGDLRVEKECAEELEKLGNCQNE